MRIKIITVVIFISTYISYSQQIGNGYATHLQDFTTPLLSGVYGGPNAIGKAPDNSHDWQHLFVIRHANPDNNYQLQLSSTYSENDKLFFRKIDNTTNSIWYELATRGTNSFTGNQSINGNLAVGNLSTSNSKFEVTGGEITTSLTNINNTLTQRINTANPAISIGLGYLNSDMPFIQSFNNITLSSNSLNLNPFGGNVGIGTTNPKNKLDVNGTIHSKEVKVDMLDWSDFVFKKEYKLPTLAEVEKHIAEKGHLENIPNEEEVLENGINLGEMNAKLLQKIEEMTLYIIEQEKKSNKQSQQIDLLNEKLSKIEKLINSK